MHMLVTCVPTVGNCCMGVDHGGDRGNKSPRIWSGGTLIQIVSPRFCHIGTKMSVLWPSKYAQIAFSAPDPAGGAHDAPPDPLVGWRGDTPPICHPTRHGPNFGTRHASPQTSSQIYAYELLVTAVMEEVWSVAPGVNSLSTQDHKT